MTVTACITVADQISTAPCDKGRKNNSKKKRDFEIDNLDKILSEL